MNRSAKFYAKIFQLFNNNSKIIAEELSYVSRLAKFDAKFINFFARLFILFYRSSMHETFRAESKVNKQAKKLKFASNFADRST